MRTEREYERMSESEQESSRARTPLPDVSRLTSHVSRLTSHVSRLLVIFALCGTLYANKKDVGTSGSQFLKIGLGNAKALGLGRASVAYGEGIESMIYNPAGLAKSNSAEALLSLTSWIDDLKGHYIAYGHPFLRSNVGINGAYLTLGDFDTRDASGVPLVGSNVFVRLGYVGGAFAWSLPNENFFMGLGVKMVMEDYSTGSEFNMASDVGFMWRLSAPFQIGASLANASMDSDQVPWTLRGGFAWDLARYVTVTADLIQDQDSKTRLGSGLNIAVSESKELGLIDLRVGYFSADNQGESKLKLLKNFNLQRTSGISYGLGFSGAGSTLYRFGFDYAFLPLGALGSSHHIAFKVAF